VLQCAAVCVTVCAAHFNTEHIDIAPRNQGKRNSWHISVCCSVLQCVAVCCSVLQCVAVCVPVCGPSAEKTRKKVLMAYLSVAVSCSGL